MWEEGQWGGSAASGGQTKGGEWGRRVSCSLPAAVLAGYSSKMLSHHLGQAGSSKITSVTLYSL